MQSSMELGEGFMLLPLFDVLSIVGDLLDVVILTDDFISFHHSMMKATNNEYNQEALYESNACEYVVQVLRKCGDDQRVLLPAWGAVW